MPLTSISPPRISITHRALGPAVSMRTATGAGNHPVYQGRGRSKRGGATRARSTVAAGACTTFDAVTDSARAIVVSSVTPSRLIGPATSTIANDASVVVVLSRRRRAASIAIAMITATV